MVIKTKITLYAGNGTSMGTIRPGTVGVDHNRIVRFYDVSGVFFAAFSRQDCLENKEMFECRPEQNDQEVPLKDVLKVLEKYRGSISAEVGERIVSELIGL